MEKTPTAMFPHTVAGHVRDTRRESGKPEAPAHSGPQVLRSRAAAEAHLGAVCFKHGPPRLAGAELEWLLYRPQSPRSLPEAPDIAAALGPYAPLALDPTSPARSLPAGSAVTVEPGGQVELASPPLPNLSALLWTVAADIEALHRRLAAAGLRPGPRAADAVRGPQRVLQLPRYRVMEQSFDRRGPHGRSAMCSTASVQVCLDAGERSAVGARWAALHALGPVLLAAFANSPTIHGRRTGWKSSRWACWQQADPARTAPPSTADTDLSDPAGSWARRVLASPLLLVRQGRSWAAPRDITFADWLGGALPEPPTTADLDYHVTTLFPPVRARGHLEVRYIDAQRGRRWALPVAVLVALMSDPATIDQVRAECAPAAERWSSAARNGLADLVLARAAAAVFELALGRLPAVGAPEWVITDLAAMIERQVLQGKCPADDPDPADGAPA